jgi:uncharacterized delta-60 repeat protein
MTATPALAAAGDLDPTFAGDGIVVTPITSGRDDYGQGMVIDGNNRVVVVGVTHTSTSSDFTVARYTLDGSLDPAFSGDGKVSFGFPVRVGASPSNDSANDVAVQQDGKVVVVGSAGNAFAVARLTSAGALDSTFSGDGRTAVSFSADASSGSAHDVAIQPDGKIVVVGRSTGPAGSSSSDFAVARLRPSDGALDTTFSGDGRLLTDFAGASDAAQAVELQTDGKIVAVGTTSTLQPLDSDAALARYTTQGALDSTFSGDGRQTTELGDDGEVISAAAIQANGRIVIAGYRSTTSTQFAVARYTSGGGLDTTFSGDGKQFTTFSQGAAFGFGVAIQADGKIVVVGSVGFSDVQDLGVVRYTTVGAHDPTFSGDGRVISTVGQATSDRPLDCAIAADGKIVAAGWTDAGGTVDLLVARYLAA